MLNSHLSSPKTKLVLGMTGLALTGFVFAGCSKQTAVNSESTTPANQETTLSTPTTPDSGTAGTVDQPTASPVVKAQNTTEAQTKESTQLDNLNKDSTSVDQGFNDQAINVN